MKLVKLVVASMAMLCYFQSPAQWTQKKSLDSPGRMDAMAFSLNSKIYVGGGVNGSVAFQDFWEYDPVTNKWARKADIPFFGYNASASFVIDGKGYIGTGDRGAAGFVPSAELYEYDPAADKWTQKASLYSVFADDRAQAIGFAIGGKGYIGGGYRIHTSQGSGSSSATALYDIYEYDPQANTWAHKTDIPNSAGIIAGRSSAVAAGLGDYVYIGAGCDGEASTTYADFYRYHPATNDWDTLTPMPGGIAEATAFALGTDIYIIGGNAFPNTEGTVTCWRYNTLTGQWQTDIAFPQPITSTVSAVAGNRIFMGTGTDDFIFGTPTNEWWEFVPSVVGVEERKSSHEWNIYPNPATGILSVSGKATENGKICLYDLTGRVVLESSIQAGRATLPVEGLTKGIYISVISNDAGERVSVEKISKL